MATERLSMRQTREILRQKWLLGRTHRDVARSLRVSVGAVGATVHRAAVAGLEWPQVAALTEETLAARLYSERTGGAGPRPQPDCAYLHTERRKRGVTLALLHLEYRERHPDGYGYTQFCDVYRRWLARRALTMRQVHYAGEKLFVDYAGQHPRLLDAGTGTPVEVELFVSALGASSYTYAEATATQQLPDWIASHTRAFAFYGGVPAPPIPHPLQSAGTTPRPHQPGGPRAPAQPAQHYRTALLPPPPARPRHKAGARDAGA